MQGFILSIINLTFLVILGFFCSDKVCLLHKLYTTQSHRIGDEIWLRKQCNDPVFYSNMKSHTSICEEVENRHRIGAIWYAIEGVSNSLPMGRAWGEMKAISWPILGVTAVVLILFPSIIVGWARSAYYTPPVCPYPLQYQPMKNVWFYIHD